MSKLLRLPLTLIAVLAALFFLPGIAWGDPTTPTAEECASATPPDGCTTSSDSGTAEKPAPAPPAVDPPVVLPQQPSYQYRTPAQNVPPSGGAAAQDAGRASQLAADDPVTLPDPPPSLCDQFPQAPICNPAGGGTPPTIPLTCDGLAELLGQTTGCPSSFTCEDLADLLGLTCPAGSPDCETLAALFHLEGCPQPPTNCQEFADLLGVDHCSDIPCIDTSQLPPQARDGLAPLLDGLKAIGINQCPVKPVGSTPPPGKGTYMPPTQSAQQPPQTPYYANCDDARAHGATNIPQGTPGYRPELDADHDGFACDENQAVVVVAKQPTGTLAYTGTNLGPQLNLAWTLLVLGTGLVILGRRRA
jgi:hypothetical protein